MKSLKTLATITTLVVIAFSWTACKKEQSPSNPQAEMQKSFSKVHNGGLVEDDPVSVSKVTLIMSSDFLARGFGVTRTSMPFIVSSAAKGGKPKPIADNIAPTVSITSPTQGQTVDATTITVAVSASDNVGIASVSLSVNGSVLNTLTSAPYNFSWNATSFAGTSPTLSATAKDKAGNTSSYTITVLVNTSSVPPPSGSLPAQYVSMTPPPVGNQGNEFACVPFAVVYGARSIEQYYRTGASSYNYATNILSPEYVYDQTKTGDCGSGTSITTCLDFMYNFGVTTWQTVPYSDINGCDLTPTNAQITEAANYKIANYSKIVSTDAVAIKTLLVANHPVIAGVNIDDNFTNATAGYIWNTIGSGNAPHAVIICGYDDSKNAYKVMNSWGTSWGDAGFLWVDYSVFVARAGYYSYVMNY